MIGPDPPPAGDPAEDFRVELARRLRDLADQLGPADGEPDRLVDQLVVIHDALLVVISELTAVINDPNHA